MKVINALIPYLLYLTEVTPKFNEETHLVWGHPTFNITPPSLEWTRGVQTIWFAREICFVPSPRVTRCQSNRERRLPWLLQNAQRDNVPKPLRQLDILGCERTSGLLYVLILQLTSPRHPRGPWRCPVHIKTQRSKAHPLERDSHQWITPTLESPLVWKKKGAKGETLLELYLRVIFSRIIAKSTQSTIWSQKTDVRSLVLLIPRWEFLAGYETFYCHMKYEGNNNTFRWRNSWGNQ